MTTRTFVSEASKQRAPKAKFAIPDGWVARGFSFEVEWPEEKEAASLIRSQFGGRRYAYNWGLGQVKADMDAHKIDPAHKSVQWNLYALRKRWNAQKATVAPWWAENSKEAYATGIADLAVALKNWSDSKKGKRKGGKVGFPKFRCRHKDQARVRFTTGVIRVEPNRRMVTLPVVGTLRSKENTRRLECRLGKGSARILNATLSQRWGRLFVSFGCIVENHPHATPTKERAGVDLGMRVLATIADTDGNIIEVPNSAPLRATLTKRRRVGRQLSRRIPGSLGHSAAKAKLARLDRRCVNLRQQASHQLTTMLAATYREVVIEDLDLAAMKKSMGRRAFRRSVSDAALGRIRPQLSYKMGWRGTQPTVADRWFASSKIHHGCRCGLIEPKKLAKQLVCAVTGDLVDRDRNAAQNLRDWPDYVSCGSVGATAPFVPGPSSDGTGGGSDALGTWRADVRPLPRRCALRGEARTEPGNGRGTPSRGATSSGLTRVHSVATVASRGAPRAPSAVTIAAR
ncbi:MAG: IS607 family element RNA-guided endonuclease TnpB [Candidatus Dormibacteria bacterium]